MNFKLFVLPFALSSLHISVVHAQEESEPDEKSIEVIEISADKVGNPVDERVSALEGAQLISSDYIRAQQAATLEEALRKTTSVQVDQNGGNQGSNVIVRGLSGDRVSTRIDGVPKNFNQTRHGGAGSVWIDPEIIQNITVIPGVASNLYGSGSLGGILDMETRDPNDAISDGSDFGFLLRQGYESNGDSVMTGFEAGANLTDDTAGLFNYTYRDMGAYEDGNGNQAVGGSTGSRDTNLLTKLVHRTDNVGSFEITMLDMDKSFQSRGAISRGRRLASGVQQTDVDDVSYSLKHSYQSINNDWLNVSSQIATTTTERTRQTIGLDDLETWRVSTDFAEVQNQSLIPIAGIEHQINFGFDYTADDILTAYQGLDGNQLERERKIWGLYASDRFAINQRLSFVLGLRYDNFSSRDIASGESSDNEGFFPKLHIDWKPFETLENLSLFGVIGKSFRAPSVHEAFGRGATEIICEQGRRGFECNEYVPNSSLEAEKSDSFELGLRYSPSAVFTKNDELYAHFIYVYNDLENFISDKELENGTTLVDGTEFDVNRTTFENIARAEISGVEMRINYTNDHFFTALSAQKLEGEDKDTGNNLVDISPASANFSIGAYLYDQRVRTGIDVNWRDEREVDEDSSFNRLSYTIVDGFVSYRINDTWNAQLRVSNLLDELYTKRYQSLSVDPETSEQTDLTYYEPGRNFRLMIRAQF